MIDLLALGTNEVPSIGLTAFLVTETKISQEFSFFFKGVPCALTFSGIAELFIRLLQSFLKRELEEGSGSQLRGMQLLT